MRNFLPFLITFFAIQFSYSQYEGYSSDSWNKQVKAEEIFSKKIDKSSFKKHLKKLTERPHVVGSEGNAEVIRYIGQIMDDAGFKVTNYPYDVYLSLIHI